MNLSDVVLNPVRMRIIQELALRGEMTTTALCQKIPDVPRTTMYRHISLLLEYEVLKVTAEKKVRGSLERSLALVIETLSRDNTIENAPKNAYLFLMNRYVAFRRYFAGKHADPGRDKLFLNTSILMLDDDEFDRFLGELRLLLTNYIGLEAAAGRKARDISIISSPVEKDGSHD